MVYHFMRTFVGSGIVGPYHLYHSLAFQISRTERVRSSTMEVLDHSEQVPLTTENV